MKRFRLRTGKGQRIVGSGESHQDFHRMSAGAHKGAPRLRQLPCLPFHLLHFRPARQGAYGQFHQSVISLHALSALRLAELGGRHHLGQFVRRLAMVAGEEMAQLASEHGDGTGFHFLFHSLYPCIQCKSALGYMVSAVAYLGNLYHLSCIYSFFPIYKDTDKIGKQSNIQEGFFQKKGREGHRNFR